jgi:XRN-Two Binding Domain, XTBD/G-patch domain
LFEEDEILCLAQVFVNMEFLGCKYPSETMLKVAQLAQAVPEIVRYRMTRRNNLKRTFVGAKDAVQAKLKKTEAPRKLGNVRGDDGFISNTTPMADLGDWTTTDRAQFSMTLDKTQKLNNLRGLLNDVVNFEVPENPSAGFSKTVSYLQKLGKLEMKFEEQKYLYIFRGQIIGEGKGIGKKEAKKKADEDLIATLKANCYTIVHKKAFYTVDEVVTPNPTEVIAQNSNKLKEDNLGFKMLKMLGWKGGSLGTKGEGIVDPVTCEIKIGRRGLGGASEQLDPKYIRQLIRNFKESQVEYDLVFNNEFTKEERAQIHK